MQIYFSQFPFPLGLIRAASCQQKIIRISLPSEADSSFHAWLKRKIPAGRFVHETTPVIETLFAQLSDYFHKRLKQFEVPLEFHGTEFEGKVWTEVLKIPYGRVISYSELAARVNQPDSVRAVGRANGANPVPIVVPCHRVVGKDGSLVGYGGGLATKRALLAFESDQKTFEFAEQISNL